MKIIPTQLREVLLIEHNVFGDQRGFFLETYQKERFAEVGIRAEFVQDNLSFSVGGTLRGLHYQHPHGQAKLMQVLSGKILDVAVDIRHNSATFGQGVAITLDAQDHQQFFIPSGFAHGFCVISDTALFSYKCSDYYAPQHEGGVLWNDPDLNIEWPIDNPILSDRDKKWPRLRDIPVSELPTVEK
jgi:dTDP-4-dehydrorhamnose 3,5-epimerase